MNGSTSNRDDYQQKFLQHVHRLLQLGYASLPHSSFATAEEDDITGELCNHMQILTEEKPTERWMSLYSVHDQHPLHGASDPTDGRTRRGKRRPRLDIRFVSKAQLRNPRFCVEAKRLYRSDSVSSYMDDEGLGAFTAGYYAKDDAAGGMLGYVQTDSIAHWQTKIESRLETESSSLAIAGKTKSSKHLFKAGPTHTFRSRHKRSKSTLAIDIFHTLLLFS
jgi:hypothetical protein